MDNHDKIFVKIKNAALHQEVPDFQSIDKVWSRVETKLDQKVLKKENKLWKKIAIAASILLFFTIGYQFLKPEKNSLPMKIKLWLHHPNKSFRQQKKQHPI